MLWKKDQNVLPCIKGLRRFEPVVHHDSVEVSSECLALHQRIKTDTVPIPIRIRVHDQNVLPCIKGLRLDSFHLFIASFQILIRMSCLASKD